MGGSSESIVERLKDCKEEELQNSEVSEQRGHDSTATFIHIILQSIQFFTDN
jgi:hypothetical protein